MAISAASLNAGSLNALERPWVSWAVEADAAVSLGVVVGEAAAIKGANATPALTLGCEAIPERWRLGSSDIRAGVSIIANVRQAHGAGAVVSATLMTTAAIVALVTADVSVAVVVEAIAADEIGEAIATVGFGLITDPVKMQPATSIVALSSGVDVSNSLLLATRYPSVDCGVSLTALADPAVKYSGDSFFTHYPYAEIEAALALEDAPGWFIADEQRMSSTISLSCLPTMIRPATATIASATALAIKATAWAHPLVGFIAAAISIDVTPHKITGHSADVSLNTYLAVSPINTHAAVSVVSVSLIPSIESKLIPGGAANIAIETSINDSAIIMYGGSGEVAPTMGVIAEGELAVQVAAEVEISSDFFSRGILAKQGEVDLAVSLNVVSSAAVRCMGEAEMPVDFLIDAEARMAFHGEAEMPVDFLVDAEAFANVTVAAPVSRTVIVDYEDRNIVVNYEPRMIEVN